MELNKELAEFVGILLGDGFMWNKNNHYRIGITISSENKTYQAHVKSIIECFHNGYIRDVTRNRATYLIIHSKSIFNALNKELEIPSGRKKGEKGLIPKTIIDNKLENYCIKGLFDTDGTFFKSNKKGCTDYPTIEFTNTNQGLINQMDKILKHKGFKTHVRAYKGSHKKTFKLSLYGKKMLALWLQTLGQSFKIRGGNSAWESARRY